MLAPARFALEEWYRPAPQLHRGARPHLQRDPAADLQRHHVRQPHHLLVQHRLQLDVRVHQLLGQVDFPDAVTAKFLTHELLQQQLAHRLDRGVGQHQVQTPTPVLHIDTQPRQDRGVRKPADGGKPGIDLQPFEPERHRAQRVEARGQIGQHDGNQPLDQRAFDRGVGPALDPHRRRAPASTQQHVHNRIDQRAVDHHQAVIVPLLDLEHCEHRRQRDRVQVVAEPEGNDRVDAHLDSVTREVAQRRAHDPHEAVEHHLQHRQAFVGDEPAIDDALHARGVTGWADLVAEYAVDVGLVQDEGVVHCTIISTKRTAVTRAGATARFVRASSSSRRRYVLAVPRNSSGRISRK